MLRSLIALSLFPLALAATPVAGPHPCCKTKTPCCSEKCCKTTDNCCKGAVKNPCAHTCPEDPEVK